MPRADSKAKKAAKDRETPAPGEDDVPLPGQEWDTGGNETELVEIDSIVPHPDNPNSGDIDSIEESMDENGWYGTITAQVSTRRIIAGEHRWRAAKRKGATKVPVFWKDCDDVTAIRILLADNATAARGVINRDKVGRLLEVIGDIRGTGIDPALLEAVDGHDKAQTAAAEVHPTVGPGDVDKLYEPGHDVYESQYAVVVMCEDEKDQEAKYEKATKLGWKVKAISV